MYLLWCFRSSGFCLGKHWDHGTEFLKCKPLFEILLLAGIGFNPSKTTSYLNIYLNSPCNKYVYKIQFLYLISRCWILFFIFWWKVSLFIWRVYWEIKCYNEKLSSWIILAQRNTLNYSHQKLIVCYLTAVERDDGRVMNYTSGTKCLWMNHWNGLFKM